MQLSEIGRFSRTHGIRGHLVLQADADLDLENLKAVFIESATGKAPYFIEELNEAGQGLIVKLEEVDAVETAKKLLNKTLYADASLVFEEETSGLEGYEVIDEKFGSLGKIQSVSDNGEQQLLRLSFREKEIILPLVEEFIADIDDASRTIRYKAPEGLIDLYLE